MKRKIILFSILILTLLILNTLLCSCSKKSAKPTPNESEEESEKAPDTLKELEASIQDILKELDAKKEPEKKEAEIKVETKTEIKQEESKDKSSNENKQETTQEVKKESEEDKKWESVSKKVEEIHKQWDSLQPEVVKAATPKKTIDDFSNTLNTLTIYAESKDMQNTLSFTNELYRLIPDFLEQYKDKIPPDVKRMTYFIRDAKYNGKINQWEKSASSINNLKSHWAIVKAQAKKEQEKQISQVDFSIIELEKVVILNNMILTDLKSNITLENIKKLEESFQK
ncbi:MAG: hypothetical protein AB7G87_03240 [Clostridia bacterium]